MMPDHLPAGPYRQIVGAGGQNIPYYIIPFDKQGTCIGPRTLEHLLSEVDSGDCTDIFLFSHGWNNDFSDATAAYEGFIDGYLELKRTYTTSGPDNHRPLVVGVYWPSATLVFGEEKGPRFASHDPRRRDPAVNAQLAELEALAEMIDEAQRSRFYELAQSEALTREEAIELAVIILDLPDDGPNELGVDSANPEELVELWRKYLQSDRFADLDPGNPADFGGAVASHDHDPDAAGVIGDVAAFLDPRPILRLPTVWRMKDRAGIIGAQGVGPILRELLARSGARVHVIGHSFGAKVLLSAICIDPPPSRPVASMLLLQPAISHLAFADIVPGLDRPGGYNDALARVEKPILSTYSTHDFPLRKAFHFAVRRKSDIGEVQIAATEPPSRFAALGGFGPTGCDAIGANILDPGNDYNLDPNARIYGVDASRTVRGHSDICNPSTWWMLYSLAQL